VNAYVLLAVANVINIGADIGALGAAAALLIQIPASLLMVIFSAAILVLPAYDHPCSSSSRFAPGLFPRRFPRVTFISSRPRLLGRGRVPTSAIPA
jgi:hypothetical protein